MAVFEHCSHDHKTEFKPQIKGRSKNLNTPFSRGIMELQLWVSRITCLDQNNCDTSSACVNCIYCYLCVISSALEKVQIDWDYPADVYMAVFYLCSFLEGSINRGKWWPSLNFSGGNKAHGFCFLKTLVRGGTHLKRWYGYVRWSRPPFHTLLLFFRSQLAAWFSSLDPNLSKNIKFWLLREKFVKIWRIFGSAV